VHSLRSTNLEDLSVIAIASELLLDLRNRVEIALGADTRKLADERNVLAHDALELLLLAKGLGELFQVA